MASKQECLNAFKFVGINEIIHTPTPIMLELVQSHRNKLGPAITPEQDYLLMNAIRCNAICEDIDSPEMCIDKYNRYFDEVEAYEVYHELSVKHKKNITQNSDFVLSKTISSFDLKNIVFRIIPTDQLTSGAAYKQNYDISIYTDDNDTNEENKYLNSESEYVVRPVITGSYLYNKLLEENYIIKNLNELKIDINKVILPYELNPSDIRVMILDEVSKWVLVTDNNSIKDTLESSEEWEVLDN
jgi:hypothetical protein